MTNKVYKITKDVPLYGLKKGQIAKLDSAVADEHGFKEHKPKAGKGTPEGAELENANTSKNSER